MRAYRRLKIAPRKIVAILLVAVALSLVVFVAIPSLASINVRPSKPAPMIGFKVKGNKIYDPAGHVFIVKGITAVWGRFSGSPYGVGITNYRNAQRDLDSIKALGANFIRLFVSAHYAYLPSTDPQHLPDYMQELDNIVIWTTERRMVVELTNSLTDDFTTSLQFVSFLAARYKDKPYVWIEPMNEPNCESGEHAKCYDWKFWQFQHLQYVQAIRNAGNTAPIVVNTIAYSSDLSQIGSYKLNDADIVYGIHCYANTNLTFTSKQQRLFDQHWADFAVSLPVIVDEVGVEVGKGTYHPLWNQAFLDFATNWVNTRQGSGVVAYNWYTDEDNSMTGNWRNHVSNDVLTSWGKMFRESYLQKVV